MTATFIDAPSITGSSSGLVNSAAANGNNYVFLAEGGGSTAWVLCSQNAGASWSVVNIPNPTFGDWNKVKYGGGTFIAIGGGIGQVSCARSPNGVTWTALHANLTTGVWADLVYGNSIWVAVCANPFRSAYSANNGSSWTFVNTTIECNTVVFGGGIFVAKRNLSGTSYITTTDGAIWTSRTAPFPFSVAVYGNGVFLASTTGGVCTSVDGINWVFTALGFTLGSVIYNGYYFISKGTAGFIRSVDGITWTQLENIAGSVVYLTADLAHVLAARFDSATNRWVCGRISGLDIAAPLPPPPIFWTVLVNTSETP